MKKVLIALFIASVFTSSSVAQTSDLYVGFDVLGNSNTITTKVGNTESEKEIGSHGFKLKLGTKSEDDWRFQGYFLHEKYDKTVFDAFHDEFNELGFDLIKGFEATPKLSPFVQIGLGFGQMDLSGYTEDSIAALSVKVGAGMMYRITPVFEALVGIDFQGRVWQDITVLNVTVKTSESSAKLYAGLNIHF